MKGGIILVSVLFFTVVLLHPAWAQPLPPENAPIDGGLVSILLLGAGGGALAAKKIRENKRNR